MTKRQYESEIKYWQTAWMNLASVFEDDDVADTLLEICADAEAFEDLRDHLGK